VSYTSRDKVTVSEMGPIVAVGSAKAQGSKENHAKSGQGRLEQPERRTKRHIEWLAVGASGAPSRGPDILKLCI
jgi:hypothetical protein